MYGPQLAALPHYMAKYRFNYADEQGNVSGIMPGGAPDAQDRTTLKDTRYYVDPSASNGVNGGDTTMT